jgi:hypothetical protein
VPEPAFADIVITSVYGKRIETPPERTIAVIGENVRPDFSKYRYSLSPDFDTYGGRNHRYPEWFGSIAWPGKIPPSFVDVGNNHGHEPSVKIDALMSPRPDWASIRSHQRFCCFVAGKGEPHRNAAFEYLTEIGAVDGFGNLFNNPLRKSKYELLPGYRFNLCFENSAFPGYYTEKPLQAWVGSCIPLYYSDPWFRHDFNPKAVINRIDFPSLADFVRHVAEVERSPGMFDAIAAEPLLTKRPSLDGPVAFLAEVARRIVDAAPRRIFPATQSTSAVWQGKA